MEIQMHTAKKTIIKKEKSAIPHQDSTRSPASSIATHPKRKLCISAVVA
jgi:hypothetical protein